MHCSSGRSKEGAWHSVIVHWFMVVDRGYQEGCLSTPSLWWMLRCLIILWCWVFSCDGPYFRQVGIRPEDFEKTVLISYLEQFKRIVIPFGLYNALATFKISMEQTLAGIMWSKCFIYLYDIVTFSGIVAVLLNWRAVLKRLSAPNIPH